MNTTTNRPQTQHAGAVLAACWPPAGWLCASASAGAQTAAAAGEKDGSVATPGEVSSSADVLLHKTTRGCHCWFDRRNTTSGGSAVDAATQTVALGRSAIWREEKGVFNQSVVQFSQQKSIADRVRGLLLCGVRAAALWQGNGGSRWQLLFGRAGIIAPAKEVHMGI